MSVRRLALACILGVVLLAAPRPASAQTIVSSFFSTGTEGWTLSGDPVSPTPTYQSTGGDSGGFIQGLDSASGIMWYFNAPAAYLGNKSAAFGGSLQFSLQQSSLANQVNFPDVFLTGNGITLARDTTLNPTLAPDWQRYSVGLTQAGWRVNDLSGALATPAQMQSVLANLTSIRIRGEFSETRDTGGLDRVKLAGPLGADPDPVDSVVPEPGSLALLLPALAACLLGGGMRRRPRGGARSRP